MKRAFVIERGIAAPLPLANVDTDRILPARFLKTVQREGLGTGLFHSLRFDERGAERPEFILNRDGYRQAKLLVTLENFGCGSSREHAPWALDDFGIRCLIAPSFAEIFFANCIENALFPLVLPRPHCELLLSDTATASTATLTVDLPAQKVIRTNGDAIPFAIDPSLKRTLLTVTDRIDATLSHGSAIAAREDALRLQRPWIGGTNK